MLSQERLVELYRELKERKVLSIYVDGEGRDPAERKAWRTRLDQQMAEVRRGPAGEEGSQEGEEAAAAARLLLHELSGYNSFLPSRGWVGFATADRVWHAESVPVPMPDLVRWERGIRVAPYVRALKQGRVVVTALVDSRKARIFTYRDGVMEEPVDLQADQDLGDLSDTNVSKRATVWSGVGGETATDHARRVMEVNTERMVKLAVNRLVELVGPRGFIVVGGAAEAESSLLNHLPRSLQERTLEVSSLRLDMSLAEVKKAAEAAATALSRRDQEKLAEEVVDLTRSGGRGSLGERDTEKHLRERRVDTLVLSRGFIREKGERADHLVGATFEQGGEVEEISGDGAALLDAQGGGVGARLRW